MKEIKAFLHRGRAADVTHALVAAGFDQLSVTDVRGTLEALTDNEAEYSVQLGEAVITEVKIEIVCETERVPVALDILRRAGHSSRASGWAYVVEIEQAIKLDA